jgi:hypothetical protein
MRIHKACRCPVIPLLAPNLVACAAHSQARCGVAKGIAHLPTCCSVLKSGTERSRRNRRRASTIRRVTACFRFVEISAYPATDCRMATFQGRGAVPRRPGTFGFEPASGARCPRHLSRPIVDRSAGDRVAKRGSWRTGFRRAHDAVLNSVSPARDDRRQEPPDGGARPKPDSRRIGLRPEKHDVR